MQHLAGEPALLKAAQPAQRSPVTIGNRVDMSGNLGAAIPRRKNGIYPLSPSAFAGDIVKIALLSPGAKNPFRFFCWSSLRRTRNILQFRARSASMAGGAWAPALPELDA
jgi:hypothetical protein